MVNVFKSAKLQISMTADVFFSAVKGAAIAKFGIYIGITLLTHLKISVIY